MVHPDNSWPKFLKRMSATIGDGVGQQSNATPATRQERPPVLPPRQVQQLYQPHQQMAIAASSASLPTGLQGITLDLGRGQQSFDGSAYPSELHTIDEAPRRSSYDSALRGPGVAAAPAVIDDRPPTTERVAEFRLEIPDGVRNMTQHPGDVIVGSV
ncbi:hypothetical protein LPJ61_006596, partial [Coemansia biformis]